MQWREGLAEMLEHRLLSRVIELPADTVTDTRIGLLPAALNTVRRHSQRERWCIALHVSGVLHTCSLCCTRAHTVGSQVLAGREDYGDPLRQQRYQSASGVSLASASFRF
jgi:hypothetical protein